jgi:hypothetical protein
VGSDSTKTAAVHMGGPAACRSALTVAVSDSGRVGHERGPSRIHLVGVVQGGVEGQVGLQHLCTVGKKGRRCYSSVTVIITRCYKGYTSSYAATEPNIRRDATSTGRGPIGRTPTFKSLSRSLSVLADCEKSYGTPEN